MAEVFLSKVLPGYSKNRSCVSYGQKTFRIYGYDIKGDTPFFNINEAIKRAVEEIKMNKKTSEPIFFVMASKEDWEEYQCTRKIDGKNYYLFKLVDSVDLSESKINWSKLKRACESIESGENLFK